MESLLSPQWYQVANLRPAIRRHVELHRQQFASRIRYLLQDRVSHLAHEADTGAAIDQTQITLHERFGQSLGSHRVGGQTAGAGAEKDAKPHIQARRSGTASAASARIWVPAIASHGKTNHSLSRSRLIVRAQ